MISGRQSPIEDFEDLEILSTGRSLREPPQQFGLRGVQYCAPKRRVELVTFDSQRRRVRSPEQRTGVQVQRLGQVTGSEGALDVGHVTGHVGDDPVRLGVEHSLAEVGPQPVHLRADRRRVPLVAVQLQQELLGGEPGGMQ